MNLGKILHCAHDGHILLLEKNNSQVRCSFCNTIYPRIDGIFIFYDENRSTEVDKQQKIFFESLHSGAEPQPENYPKESHINEIWAKLRDAYSNSQFDNKLSELFISQLEPMENARILEIGCGPGTPGTDYCLANKEKLSYYVGLDLSFNPLLKLQRKISQAGAGNFYLLNMNIFDDYLFDQQFDLIFGRGIIHHLDDKKKTAERIFNLLKPGGKAVFLEPLNTNILIRLMRGLSRPFRSNLIWEHPFSQKDLELFTKPFDYNSLYYFDGLTMISLLFILNKRVFNLMHTLFYQADQSFFRNNILKSIFLRVIVVVRR